MKQEFFSGIMDRARIHDLSGSNLGMIMERADFIIVRPFRLHGIIIQAVIPPDGGLGAGGP